MGTAEDFDTFLTEFAEDIELMQNFRELNLNLDEIRQGIKDWNKVIKKIKNTLNPRDEILKNDLKNQKGEGK